MRSRQELRSSNITTRQNGNGWFRCAGSMACPVLRDEHTLPCVWVGVCVYVCVCVCVGGWVGGWVCVCVCVLPWQETAHKKPHLSTAEAGALCPVWHAICILPGRPQRQP